MSSPSLPWWSLAFVAVAVACCRTASADDDDLGPARAVPGPGSYRWRGRLGDGFTGVVSRYRPATADHDVAVKVLGRFPQADAAQLEFLRAYTTGDAYVGVPRLFDALRIFDRTLVAMQLFEGIEMLDLLLPARRDPSRILTVLFKAVTILARMHARGYAHLDLKPENVLCNAAGDVMLIDCGGVPMRSARAMRLDLLPWRDFSCTEAYLAPESRLLGLYGCASDVYALGLICARMRDHDADRGPDRFVGGSGGDQRRMAAFIDATLIKAPALRPTSAQLLWHPLFETERVRFGVGPAADPVADDAAFGRVVALRSPANVAQFAAFPDPADPGRRRSLPDRSAPDGRVPVRDVLRSSPRPPAAPAAVAGAARDAADVPAGRQPR